MGKRARAYYAAQPGPAVRTLRYFCDVAPLTLQCASISDHSATRILGLCALPLLGLVSHQTSDLTIEIFGERFSPLGACAVDARDDFKQFTLMINPAHRWDDGTPICARDYARGVDQLLSSRAHRFRKLLADVVGFTDSITSARELTGMQVYDDRLVFTLKNANRLFPLYLTFPAISPLHETQDDFFAGAYMLASATDNELVLLARNPHQENAIRRIAFDFAKMCDGEPDEFGIKRFYRGVVDLTWDTYFPYDFQTSDDLACLEKTDPQIFVSLSGVDCVGDHGVAALNVLSQVVDRGTLIAACHGAPSALYGFSSCEHEHVKKDLRYGPMATVTIGYEDFYPNAIIAQELASQLTRAGVDSSIMTLAYGDRSNVSTLRLELIHSPFADPILLYRHELTKRSFYEQHRDLWHQFLSVFSRYQVSDASTRKDLAQQLDHILVARGDFLPLLKLPGLQLKRSGVGESSFISGRHWEWAL